MRTRSTVLGLLALAAGATGAAAQSQLLFLAEDVPAGLNYDGPSANINTTQTGYINLLEPLVYYPYGETNEEGVRKLDFSKFEGRLVERWEFDAPSLTWTMHLRRGVKSCAGNTFSADDVMYMFARNKSVSGAAPVGWFIGNVISIAGFTRDVFKATDRSLGDAVVKVDDYTVKIKQSEPNPLFLTGLTVYSTYPYDSVEMKKHATDADPWSHNYVNTTNAPGFGAYCLDRWTRDNEFVVKANPNYYRGKPPIDQIVMKKVPQSANRVLTLRSGRADLTQRLTAREFSQLGSAKGVKVAGIFGNETLLVNLNFKTPPFDNPKVRQAVAAAMPYQQIADVGYAGKARRWEAHYTPVLNGYAKPAAQYVQDLAKAKALLAEAGYPEGKGLEKFPEAFKLAFVAERETVLGPIATVIQAGLRDVGIPIQLDPIPQTQMGDRRLVKKDLPMSLSDQEKPVGPDVVYASLLFFVSTASGGINNIANYSSPEFDALYVKAKTEQDPGKRAAAVKGLQETVQRDLAWVPVVETSTIWAFNDKLKGVTWYPDNSLRFFDLSMGQ